MKINYSIIAAYFFFTLIPISYCIYLNAEIKNSLEEYKSLNNKDYVFDDSVLNEESAKNEEKLTNWQSSILTKGYENGIIKCYYVSSDGKQIEFPLTKWINVEFPLNKWMPKK